MDGRTLVPVSTEFRTGPEDLTSVELGRFGLGVVVRHLRGTGTAVAQPLNRVYCLFCGIAIEHELRTNGWWFCKNACNALESH